MGVSDDSNYPQGMGKSAAPLKCKRDYEGDINLIRRKQESSKLLYSGILDYIDHWGLGSKAFTLTELFGALSLEIRAADKAVYELQKEWEAEK